jgi:FAD/FMN-containing dehydrogenase
MSSQVNLIVNDIHSQLNPTRIAEIVSVDSLETIQATIHRAAQQSQAICIAGGRHAMGAQQFGTDAVLVDTTQLSRVLSFDPVAGLIEVEAGIQWPELVNYLVSAQVDRPWSQQWGIAQKQTGADRISLGGSLASNGHGRGLRMQPLIADVESFVLVNAQGEVLTCSRQENKELFRLVSGGYGLFGIIYSIKLRLLPRQKVERVVEIITVDELMPAFEQRIKAGFLYGDFQFSTNEQSNGFLRQGVFACYRPVDPATFLPEGQKELSEEDWGRLFYLSHADKAEAFRRYTDHYLATSGQVYGSDTHQLSTYLDDYHRDLDRRLGATHPASEIITEIYVPRPMLPDFLAEVRADFRADNVNLIYGTIRLIEQDTESFLAWAKQPYACVIFNLHTEHTPYGLEHSAAAFRRLIDMAIRRGGSYFLTYHRYATRQQVEACYPQFAEFLRLKRRYDPAERFQSDWYRHYREMFAEVCDH